MKQWKIPVTWEVCATIDIKADNLEQAMEIARDEEGIIPCPTDHDYVDGSWQLSDTDVEFIRQCYNAGQQDDN